MGGKAARRNRSADGEVESSRSTTLPTAVPATPRCPVACELVQRHIVVRLDDRTGKALTVVSAGIGRPLLGFWPPRTRTGCGRLYWSADPRNVATAGPAVNAAGLRNVTVVRAGAGDLATVRRLAAVLPVLLAGVFADHCERRPAGLSRRCPGSAP